MKKFLDTLRKNYIYGIMILLIIISIILGIIIYNQNNKYTIAVENQYNLAFYELIDYVEDVENYLAKSIISGSYENGAESLIHVWREANLAQAYLSQLPISSSELSKTEKFLNQVSDYSYSLSNKCINKENLTQEEIDNLHNLYNYSVELKDTLNQLSEDMKNGNITWRELTKNTDIAFAQQVDNVSTSSFSNLDENFGEYEGLIYDGAYSEHIETVEKKGLTGKNVDEKTAEDIAKTIIGKERIEKIKFNGLIENGNIICFDFSVNLKNSDKNNPLNISISKKGGHVVLMNYNRKVGEKKISQEKANKIGQDFLAKNNFPNMKATYYLNQDGMVTINYAYVQNNVTIYADLIKVKIALDNGEIVGIETSGYLNNHTQRDIGNPRITQEQAREKLNSKLEITSASLAIIPTEWRTEIFCYEFKGKINKTDFLVYINAETGDEENILVIIDTPNGVLTQ